VKERLLLPWTESRRRHTAVRQFRFAGHPLPDGHGSVSAVRKHPTPSRDCEGAVVADTAGVTPPRYGGPAVSVTATPAAWRFL